MTLQSDLERIAALRGKPANYFTARAGEPRPISPQLLAQVFSMVDGGANRDLRAYDRLPETARRFVAESTMPINAAVFAALLASVDGDEERLEDALAPLHAAKCKAWLLRHYGRGHPNLRKYG